MQYGQEEQTSDPKINDNIIEIEKQKKKKNE